MHTAKPNQLEMTFEHPTRSFEELRAELLRHGGRLVDLTLTRNRVSMVSVRFDSAGGAQVRLHASFLGAPDAVITALGRYLVKRSRHEWLAVKAYVAGMQADPNRCSTALRAADPDRCSTALRAADPDRCSTALRAADPDRCSTALRAADPNRCSTALRAADPRGQSLKTQGRIYDLAAMFEAVNRRYFNGTVLCSIGWGRRGKAKRGARSRMIRFGSYSRLENVIRINPVLDSESVPAEFVEYIMFHEMLHAVMPSVERGMKRLHHHRAYRLLERRFPDHARLQKMAVELVNRLRG